MAGRFSGIEELAASTKKAYGYNVVGTAAKIPKIDRLKIESVSFNVATGGGIPRGRISQLYGEQGSGKTTIANKLIAAGQKLCRHCWRTPKEFSVEEIPLSERSSVFEDLTHRAVGFCDCVATGIFKPRQFTGENDRDFKSRLKELQENSFSEFIIWYFDMEGKYDRPWAIINGVDANRMLFSQPETAERAVDIISSAMSSGSVDLVVLDSVAAMVPSAEVEESLEKWQQGLQARLMNKAYRKWVSDMNGCYNRTGLVPTFLCLQQTRLKIGVMFGDPTTRPGGNGQLFADALEVKIWSSEKKIEEVQIGTAKDEKMKVPTEVCVNFKVTKNQTATSLKDGYFRMSLLPETLSQILESDFIFSVCMKMGMIIQENNKYYLNGEEFTSQKGIREHWRANRVEYDIARELVTAKLTDLTL